MARFDVHKVAGEPGFFLDCQSDLLRHLNTRIAVPLRRPAEAPVEAARLNPRSQIDGEDHVMVTQFAGAIAVRDLGPVRCSLAEEHHRIIAALVFLLTGY